LALLLAPAAAFAQASDFIPPAQHDLHTITAKHAAADPFGISEVTPSSATIDNPTVVYSGVNANAFRDSLGG
jgi:hypothetical protein